MNEPPPWPHPINPTEARRAPDGRIAFHIHIAPDMAAVWSGTSEQRWYVIDTPNGQFTLTILTDEDVADWAVISLEGTPR